MQTFLMTLAAFIAGVACGAFLTNDAWRRRRSRQATKIYRDGACGD